MSVSEVVGPAARTTTRTLPGCATRTEVFTHPLLETPPPASATQTIRHRAEQLEAQARATCLRCPLVAQCLFRAVVEHDVAGYVAGTTEQQRLEIRRRLGLVVEPEDFDTLAGVTGGHRQIDHDEVLRLRRANPTESLERLAQRLGCSLSTVKRHLRKERQDPTVTAIARPRPTLARVVEVATQVLDQRRVLAA